MWDLIKHRLKRACKISFSHVDEKKNEKEGAQTLRGGVLEILDGAIHACYFDLGSNFLFISETILRNEKIFYKIDMFEIVKFSCNCQLINYGSNL